MNKNKFAEKLSISFMWILSILILYPLTMVLLTSFKSKGEASYLNISLPKTWHIENYVTVIEKGFLRAFGNSLIVTVISMFVTIFSAALIAYVVVRRDTKGVRAFYKMITLQIIAPFAAMPTIKLLQYLGLYGSRIGLALVTAALNMPYTTMIISSYLKGIPRELDEAAVIDGANGMQIFGQILFPLLKPVLSAALIVNFMWAWNDLQLPIYLLNSATKWTLPLSIYSFIGQFSSSWNLVCADLVLVSLPVVILYILCQKLVVSGMTSGAVKQ